MQEPRTTEVTLDRRIYNIEQFSTEGITDPELQRQIQRLNCKSAQVKVLKIFTEQFLKEFNNPLNSTEKIVRHIEELRTELNDFLQISNAISKTSRTLDTQTTSDSPREELESFAQPLTNEETDRYKQYEQTLIKLLRKMGIKNNPIEIKKLSNIEDDKMLEKLQDEIIVLSGIFHDAHNPVSGIYYLTQVMIKYDETHAKYNKWRKDIVDNLTEASTLLHGKPMQLDLQTIIGLVQQKFHINRTLQVEIDYSSVESDQKSDRSVLFGNSQSIRLIYNIVQNTERIYQPDDENLELHMRNKLQVLTTDEALLQKILDEAKKTQFETLLDQLSDRQTLDLLDTMATIDFDKFLQIVQKVLPLSVDPEKVNAYIQDLKKARGKKLEVKLEIVPTQRITPSTERQKQRLQQTTHFLKLEFDDYGLGYPKQILAEGFRQGRSIRQNSVQGSGDGMVAQQRMIEEELGGILQICNTTGTIGNHEYIRGARTIVYLPIILS